MARGRLEEARSEYEEALRLAYEVGAYAESPFLMARLAEIAYHSGDRSAALTALDEASAAADRWGVADPKAFVLLLRARIALDEQDTAEARGLWEAARAETGRGTPPPQFVVMLKLVDALLTVDESGPEHALPKLAGTIRESVEKRCADAVTAALVGTTAALLSDLGDFPRTARLLGAAGQWRGSHARPTPERAQDERTAVTACAALGATRYEAECAKGAALTADDVLRELDEALRDRDPARRAP
jgi:ATP/maltotriose-dependent transcriptional regulator MalT